jgi:nucleotide-binding universal stress UspA family protein
MFKTIVVGTDGSATAGIAVQRAIDIAALSGGTLHVVHAYRTVSLGTASIAASGGGPTVDMEAVNHELAEQASLICTHAAQAAERQGFSVEVHAAAGDPADAILTIAKDCGADLVVVGNRGMNGARRFVLGSVPNKVSHHCPCDLLIVDTAN